MCPLQRIGRWKAVAPRLGGRFQQLLPVNRRHPFRGVSLPEHLICQLIERKSIFLSKLTVKRPHVGLKIGDLGGAGDGDYMIPLAQHPG